MPTHQRHIYPRAHTQPRIPSCYYSPKQPRTVLIDFPLWSSRHRRITRADDFTPLLYNISKWRGDWPWLDMLVYGELCNAFAQPVKHRHQNEGDIFCLPNHYPWTFFLHMLIPVYLFIAIFLFLSLLWYSFSLASPHFFSSIWPLHLCASFPMWSYASYTYCLCTDWSTLTSCSTTSSNTIL